MNRGHKHVIDETVLRHIVSLDDKYHAFIALATSQIFFQ